MKTYLERIRDAGIVGAGGAGFPTHIKINNKAEIIIANGAECEPLLRVDRQVMEKFPDKIVKGLDIVMHITGARRGVICLKRKYKKAVEALDEIVSRKKYVDLHLIDDYYPAGDEVQMVYDVTGKVIAPGELPLSVGAIVSNVSTLMNIADAVSHIPVTERFVTVTGEVKKPVTLRVPVGTSFEHLVKLAEGPENKQDYSLIIGGPAMGKVENDWTEVVTKTIGGVIVLPKNHRVITKKTSPLDWDYRRAKSVCSQCSFCTQMCPRNNLGLNVQPHKVMRAVGYNSAEAIGNINSVFSCCDCGLCTFYACDMELSPGRMVTTVKQALMKKGMKPDKKIPYEVNTMRDFKKVPSKRFVERLGLGMYDVEAPLKDKLIEVDRVRIPLKQHIGAPAVPAVKKGDKVKKGDMIGTVDEGTVGANVHASITGTVYEITDHYIEIRA